MAVPKLQTSDETRKYKNELATLEANKPAAYQSQNTPYLDNLLNQITNRKFSYDFNADPLYQQYKQNYTKLGNEASMNAAANASALTGGYGNSYATTAAAQANQQYLTQLNDVIPELYDAALNKYNSDTSELYNQYGLYQQKEDTDYGRYRDNVNDYYSDRDYVTNRYDASKSNDQWNSTYNYNAYRDNVADDQWKQEFNYQKEQDRQTQANADREYELAVRKLQDSTTSDANNTKDYSDYTKSVSGTIDRSQGVRSRDSLDSFKRVAINEGRDGVYAVLADLLNNGKIKENDVSYVLYELYGIK